MSLRDQPSVKIYGDMRIRAFRVVWMCEELALPWELEQVWPWSNELYSVNPLGKVRRPLPGKITPAQESALVSTLQ